MIYTIRCISSAQLSRDVCETIGLAVRNGVNHGDIQYVAHVGAVAISMSAKLWSWCEAASTYVFILTLDILTNSKR